MYQCRLTVSETPYPELVDHEDHGWEPDASGVSKNHLVAVSSFRTSEVAIKVPVQ
jgi:hypothetical protein